MVRAGGLALSHGTETVLEFPMTDRYKTVAGYDKKALAKGE